LTSSRGRLLIAAGCLGLGAAAIAIGRPVKERPAASVLAAGSRISIASAWRERVDTVHRGEPLTAVLQRAGIAPKDAAEALKAASGVDARRIRAGTTITTRVNPDSGSSEIVLQLAIDRVVRLSRSAAASWTEKEERLAWSTDTVVVGGVVQSTLANAIADGADAFPAAARLELAYTLADLLEYRVDLSRDLQKGDSVRVLVERQQAPNGLVRNGNIIAARLTVDGKPVETVRFEQGARVSYFDGEGKSMRAAFLRTPVAFRRISSVFGMRRHPILGIRRAHQGIDYAAAAGTPVRALGNGRVIFAGWKGGYGRVVEIRHTNGYVTRYGHLSAFGSGVRAGATVAISQTIGRVGASGLATAPHLHFEVLVGGVHRNPSVAFKNQTGEPLAASQRSNFAALKTRLFTALDGPLHSATTPGKAPRPGGD
jgi:murein DD-endopeptidase MepM/ murein hydrolase activator NlpD